LFDSSLIKTKYCIPRANPRIVSRQRLLEKLDHVLERMLTLVVAPMGYGKTTAVYEWVEKAGLQTAWLSLDESENDPIVFWKYICAAMEKILPELENHVEYAFSSPQLLEANVHINILIDRLAQHDGKVVLVIDDLHTTSSAPILKGLSHLLDYLPANAHMIIISRAEPAMELNKFELRSQVLRITAKDLRFRQDEIADFYLKRDCALGQENIEKICNYTEGWAAAMVAIAISAGNDRVNQEMLNGITATNADTYQYLMNEVFESYSPEKKAFLLKISILELLQEDICRALTGENNVAHFFEDMRKRNEFLALFGDESKVYRMHPILRDFLLKKLKQTDPDKFTRLHTQAALWHRSQGLLAPAVSHYLEAMRYAEAFELIEMQLDHFASQNQYETPYLWIEQLPAYYTHKSIKIAVFYSMYYAQNRSFELSANGWLVPKRCWSVTKRGKSAYKFALWSALQQSICCSGRARRKSCTG
jgi:LuxR family maltose regulon positive regulatory protein